MSVTARGRWLFRATRQRSRGILIDFGALPYCAPDEAVGVRWDEEYTSGSADYGQITELARFSVLLGYLRSLGDELEILDFGCGTGVFRKHLDGVPFGRYVGVDPSAVALEQAAAAHPADSRTSYVVGDRVPDDLGCFDVVVLSEVLYYAEDPRELLDAVARVVRPGGYVLSSVWRHPGDGTLAKMLAARFQVIDAVELQNRAARRRRLRWRLALHRRAVVWIPSIEYLASVIPT